MVSRQFGILDIGCSMENSLGDVEENDGLELPKLSIYKAVHTSQMHLWASQTSLEPLG